MGDIKKRISDLMVINTVSDESRYVVETPEGTRSVTHKTLAALFKTTVASTIQALNVIFNDKKTAEAKLGAIDGITDSLSSENSRIAASSKALKEVSDSLIANGTRLYADYHDGKYGVNTSPNRGADTFIPFKQSANVMSTHVKATEITSSSTTISFKGFNKGKYMLQLYAGNGGNPSYTSTDLTINPSGDTKYTGNTSGSSAIRTILGDFEVTGSNPQLLIKGLIANTANYMLMIADNA